MARTCIDCGKTKNNNYIRCYQCFKKRQRKSNVSRVTAPIPKTNNNTFSPPNSSYQPPVKENKNENISKFVLRWGIRAIIVVILLWMFDFPPFMKTNVEDTDAGYSETGDETNENPYEYTTIDHNCPDFSTQGDAQLFFEANGGPDSDPHDLDRDGDGMACDWNP